MTRDREFAMKEIRRIQFERYGAFDKLQERESQLKKRSKGLSKSVGDGRVRRIWGQ